MNSNGGKVLLLHGSRQTGDLLVGRMDKLRKRLQRQNLEVVAPTAHFSHPDDPELRQWWNRSGDEYQGLVDETIPQLTKMWDEDNKGDRSFVGIIGFSQGARLAHLCALAHASSPHEYFSGLKFVLMVAGYEAPLPTGFGEACPPLVTTPSLHVWGSTDKLITPNQSQAVLSYYENPLTHEHEAGHHVPMRAASVRIYEEFIQSALVSAAPSPSKKAAEESRVAPEPPKEPDAETAELQRDEVEALSAIFPDEFHMLSKVTPQGDAFEYAHPIRYRVDLVASEEGTWPKYPLAIEVGYTFEYPQNALPSLRLVHENNMMEFSTSQAAAVLDAMNEAAQAEQGMPSVMSCIYAARDFFESGAMATISSSSSPEKTPQPPADAEIQTDAEPSTPSPGLIQSSSRERIEQCNLEGLRIAKSVLELMGNKEIEAAADNPSVAHLGKGGHWTFTIGLVGKPSAGKSTFFNAATAFARQRDDADNLLGGATMAPHPFTTIDPNVGYCLVPASVCSCPEEETSDSFAVGSTHGRDHKGRRLLPVLLKDVAGLVPGAYQGRGRGNKFLNDLTDADVLVHVLDASGTADVEGNNMGTDTDGQASAEASNPLNDMAWIRTELIEWVFSNLMYKWDTIKRKGRSKLTDMFGGYGQSQAVTNHVLVATEKFLENTHGREQALNHLMDWDEGDVHRLVSCFLGVRFPMALALNKCDLPTSPANVANIEAALPVHGAHVATPLSARSEMNFVRHHIEQQRRASPSKENGDAKERALPDGVWSCLQSALALREPVLVFPVLDMSSYAPLPGMFKCSTSDASLPSAGMIQCLKAAGGTAPSLWSQEASSYYSSPDNTTTSNSPPQAPTALRDCLLMKPGSTVDDVFLTLKRLGAMGGDFVRAEAAGSIGAPSRPVPKHQKLNQSNRILKIMTSKRASWQKN